VERKEERSDGNISMCAWSNTREKDVIVDSLVSREQLCGMRAIDQGV